MVDRSGDKGLSQDRSRCDGIRTTVPAEAVPEPRRSAAHEQREELDRHCRAVLYCAMLMMMMMMMMVQSFSIVVMSK